ncbi:ribosome-inactivating family protein [Streptomyces sp. SID13726]|uniref:ribosome-inactivating family protein n=1 Tax=Streptomyces sp. SID13726 TaxID=2706058 RepID=UPI0013B9BFBA|nr:ribosome-inactivating family protein [Streptomyces sp. SID13726]NEA98519.1 hypothetical protein [Streptomyces sp. SID13726]
MSVRVLRRLGISLALPAMAVGALSLAESPTTHPTSKDTHAAVGTRLGSDTVQTVAVGDKWSKVVWDVDGGSTSYAELVNSLRAAVAATGGHRTNVNANGRNLAVDVTGTNDREFIDLEVRTAGANIHLVVRASDMYVIGYHFWDQTHGNTYYPLAREGVTLPSWALGDGHSNTSTWEETATFLGHENYNDLARMAGTALRDVTLNQHNLRQAIFDMRTDPQGRDANSLRNKAGGVLRMIAAVSEGVRSRPLANDLGRALHMGTNLNLAPYVDLINNWSSISNIVTTPGSPAVQTSNHGWVRTAADAAALLLVALAHRASTSNIHDEL